MTRPSKAARRPPPTPGLLACRMRMLDRYNPPHAAKVAPASRPGIPTARAKSAGRPAAAAHRWARRQSAAHPPCRRGINSARASPPTGALAYPDRRRSRQAAHPIPDSAAAEPRARSQRSAAARNAGNQRSAPAHHEPGRRGRRSPAHKRRGLAGRPGACRLVGLNRWSGPWRFAALDVAQTQQPPARLICFVPAQLAPLRRQGASTDGSCTRWLMSACAWRTHTGHLRHRL